MELAPTYGSPALAWTGSGFLAAWSGPPTRTVAADGTAGGGALSVAALDPAGTLRHGPTVFFDDAERVAIAASSGGGATIVFAESYTLPAEAERVRLARSDASGSVAAAAREIVPLGALTFQSVHVAALATEDVVLWSQPALTYLAIPPSGPLSGPQNVPTTGKMYFAYPGNVVPVGEGFAFAMRATGIAASPPRGVHLVVSTAAGEVVSTTTLAADADDDEVDATPTAWNVPAIAWTGSDYRIAWFSYASDGTYSLTTTRASTAAVDAPATSKLGVGVAPVTPPTWNGQSWAALLVDVPSGAGSGPLSFVRFDVDGSVADRVPLAPTAERQCTKTMVEPCAALIATDREYAAAWTTADWTSDAKLVFARVGGCP